MPIEIIPEEYITGGDDWLRQLRRKREAEKKRGKKEKK